VDFLVVIAVLQQPPIIEMEHEMELEMEHEMEHASTIQETTTVPTALA
jgi:hypothetical protein